MTKKDFITLADILRGENLSQEAIDKLCAYFLTKNALFNKEKFIRYLRTN